MYSEPCVQLVPFKLRVVSMSPLQPVHTAGNLGPVMQAEHDLLTRCKLLEAENRLLRGQVRLTCAPCLGFSFQQLTALPQTGTCVSPILL